jgi:phosphohistidine swiveling domain-containing protein
MGWSLLETGMRVMFRPLRISNDAGYRVFEILYGRVYWNLTPVFGSRFIYRMLDRNLEMIGPSIRPTFDEIFRRGRVHPRPIYSIPQKLILGLQALLLIPRVAANVAWLALRSGAIDRGLDRFEADLRKPAVTASRRSRDLILELERYVARGHEGIKRHYGPAGILVMALAGPFLGLGARLMKSRSLLETLEFITPSRPSRTAQADMALWEISRRAGDLAPDSADFVRYLEAFGHRCPGEQDALSPRPWDDPVATLAQIRREGAPDPSPAARFADSARKRREAAEARLKSIGFLRRLVAAPLHRLASRAYPYREDGKHYVMLLFGFARRRLVAVGRALKEEGLLAEAGDVFFLTIQELSRLARGDTAALARIAGRRAEFERWRDFRPPLVVTSEGIPAPLLPPKSLRGDPVSPGVARGRVRVVLDPLRDGTLEAGEILVAPHTDPGWTPLFLRAAAVVTEVGGALSHVAVVAREFGLPAVVNVVDATRLLRSGQMIEVDGNSGIVRRVDPINSST